MPTGEIFAHISQMREAASAINRSVTRVTTAIDVVDQQILALTSDRFASAGADAFRTAYYRVTPRLREAFEVLSGFQEKLNAAADDIELAARSTQV